MKLISSQEIISRVYRNLNLKDEMRFLDAIEWIWEALQLIDFKKIYIHKIEELQVENYIAELPCDFHKLNMITKEGYGVTYRPNEYYYNYSCDTNYVGNYPINKEVTYDIRHPYFHTNCETGTFMIHYSAIPLDENNFPMLPDLESLKQAMFWYILKMMILSGFELNDRYINFMYCDEKANYFINVARAELAMPTLAEMENIKNNSFRAIPLTNQYKYGFRQLGTREDLHLKGRATINPITRKWRV